MVIDKERLVIGLNRQVEPSSLLDQTRRAQPMVRSDKESLAHG